MSQFQRGRQPASKPLATPPIISPSASTDASSDDQPSFKVTKLSSETVILPSAPLPQTVPLNPTSQHTPSKETLPKNDSATSQPSDASDSLQALYPWTYMSSMLDACFTNPEESGVVSPAVTKNATDSSKKSDGGDNNNDNDKNSDDDSEFVQRPERLEPDQLLEFCKELGSDKFAKEAPAVMRLFHKHGESCALIETDALKLAMGEAPAEDSDEDPLKAYNDILDDLERLLAEAAEIQEAITGLTASPVNEDTDDATAATARGSKEDEALGSAKAAILGVFGACLPILKARVSNLTMAQELVDSALENASLSLRMESMGL